MRRSSGCTISLAVPVAWALTAAACERVPLGPEPSIAPPSFALGGSDRSFAFTTIAVPGARWTVAYGINAGSAIVGAYADAGSVTHGFLLRNGEFTTIDYPGAAGTTARGISPGGEIVGTYSLPGVAAVHGFLLTRSGQFVKVVYPGHTNTIAQRILPDGTILGCWHDASGMAGVVISGTGYTEIQAFSSMNNGATPDLRRIAGSFFNTATGRDEGYVIDDGAFTPFVVPGSILTAAWDVNPAGEVAGIYRDAALVFHGYVMTAAGFTTLDYPGATATRAYGINAGGDVVGSYASGGVTRGFLASATQQHN